MDFSGNPNINKYMIQALMQGLGLSGQKDVSGVPSVPYYTGPGGLFGVSGLEREVISTVVRPMGLADMLPVRGSQIMYPLYPYLTGFTAGDDTQPEGPCDDPPTVGHGKSCIQTATYGKYSHATRVLEIGRVGQQINRGEFQDLMLVNPPMLDMTNTITTPGVDGAPGFSREVMMRMMELGIDFQRQMMKQLYIGDPANNTAGGYAEFPGLDMLISTGKVDAITNTACPSLDSQIHNFGGADAGFNGGSNLVALVTSLLRFFGSLAERTNLAEVEEVLVMREQLFYAITEVWPCAYMTYRCLPASPDAMTAQQFVNPSDQIDFRDAMRAGRYLKVDSKNYRVIFDDSIAATSVGNGCYTSDIYFLPLTIRNGSIASLFWEHLDYTNALNAAADARVSQYFFTDAGRFLWFAPPPNNRCVQLRAWLEPRIILRTPHLAGRINNVGYCPLINPREPFPDDNYYVNGGVQVERAVPDLFSEWNP